ncbi:MAG: hypothetical protein KDD06_09460 [Phaeodactylibacter sp.]|nr:hypothetical protein [Phaeodactylibacter sp.]
MLKGKVTMSLLIGTVVPKPAPKHLMDALASAQVQTSAGEASGFQLSFSFSDKSYLDEAIVLLAGVGPIVRVILTVSLNGSQEVVMDGVVTNHQVAPDMATGQTNLTVSGSDLTALMGLIDFTGIPYPAMPAEAQVALIIAKYAMFGLAPMVIPRVFMDFTIPSKEIPTHQGTDLAHVKRLAQEAGYVFYLFPGSQPGNSFAYWGPEVKIGAVQPALNVNMDQHTNVESFSASFDGDAKSIPVIFIQNEQTRAPIPIPIPDISPLNPALGRVKPIPVKYHKLTNTANYNPVKAVGLGLGEAARSADVISGNGSLDVLRYGHILKARSLVGVRGMGEALNGTYFVKSVTHNIKRGEYKQDFSLTRNALISNRQALPT